MRQLSAWTLDRLRIWREGCEQGLSSVEIARLVGVGRHCLRTTVRQGRAHGIADASAEPRSGGRGRPPAWPTPLAVERLAAWRQGVEAGRRARAIAEDLGMTESNLLKCIVEARKRGHPDAVYIKRQRSAPPPVGQYRPSAEVERRLRMWKRYATLGWNSSDIARELQVSRATLRASVIRARRHGHPDAIMHPSAEGDGLRHLYDTRAAHRRRARSFVA